MKLTTVVLAAVISLVYGAVSQKWQNSEDGSRFYVENEANYNWFMAWNECARKNMSLIAIDSYQKHLQLDNLLRKLYPTCPSFWIGCHDNAIDQRYEWSVTGEIVSFSNWGPGQPKRGVNDCVHIHIDWNWHDCPCSVKHGFICEENRYLKQLAAVRQECHENMSKFRNIIVNINSNTTFENS